MPALARTPVSRPRQASRGWSPSRSLVCGSGGGSAPQPSGCVAAPLHGKCKRAARGEHGFHRALRRRGTAQCGFDSFEPAVELTNLLRRRSLGTRGVPRRARDTKVLVIEAVMIVRKATPKSMTSAAMSRPVRFVGTLSPYPTVVTVWTPHQSPIRLTESSRRRRWSSGARRRRSSRSTPWRSRWWRRAAWSRAPPPCRAAVRASTRPPPCLGSGSPVPVLPFPEASRRGHSSTPRTNTVALW